MYKILTFTCNQHAVGFYQFVEQTYSIRENASSLQVAIELAPSSGTLLSDLTVLVSTTSSSATGLAKLSLY